MFVYMTNRQIIPCWEISIKKGAYTFYYCFLSIHNMDSYLFVMRPIFVITEEIKNDNLENR
jgi:hypothetical protein